MLMEGKTAKNLRRSDLCGRMEAGHDSRASIGFVYNPNPSSVVHDIKLNKKAGQPITADIKLSMLYYPPSTATI